MELPCPDIERLWSNLEPKLDQKLEELGKLGNRLIPETTLAEILENEGQLPVEVAARVRQEPSVSNGQKVLQYWSQNPLMYIDRMRIRNPGEVIDLAPHVDVAGKEIWTDPSFNLIYRNNFHDLEAFDPFQVNFRSRVNLAGLDNVNACTFFRAFQGWLSLSHSKPGSGTLRVLPLLKESAAFWFLRPFMPDVPKGTFPGCSPGKTLYITKDWHKKLYDSMVSIPEIHPGDTVWWHPDVVHSLERDHHGDEPNVVLYIPAGPDCPMNRKYLHKMRKSFITGDIPPDFSGKISAEFNGRATLDDVTEVGLKLMAFEDWKI